MKARGRGLEPKHARFAGGRLGDLAAASRPDHAMRVDAVADWTIGRILERKLNVVVLAQADHGAGNRAIERPIGKADAVGHQALRRLGFKLDFDELAILSGDWRRHRRRGQPGHSGRQVRHHRVCHPRAWGMNAVPAPARKCGD